MSDKPKSTNSFSATEKFRAAVVLFNSVDSDNLEVLASSIITRFSLDEGGSFFTDVEKNKMRTRFDISSDNLETLISGISYIWDESAFHSLSPDKLVSQLQEHSVSDSAVNAFGSVWAQHRQAFIAKLRDHTFAPKTLNDVVCKLQLTTAHQNLSKTKVCNAHLQLQLNNQDIHLEFNKEQLLQFYNQLEEVQNQLDKIVK